MNRTTQELIAEIAANVQRTNTLMDRMCATNMVSPDDAFQLLRLSRAICSAATEVESRLRGCEEVKLGR